LDISKSYVIAAPRDAVWAALTNPAIIERWGGGPAVMAAMPGFRFEFWGGDIHGTVRQVVPGKSLTQNWYGGAWPEPSLVRFTLTDAPDGTGTRLDLENTGVPDDEGGAINSGWDEYYLGPIKALLEDGGGR